MYEVCGQLILILLRRIPEVLADIRRLFDQLGLIQCLFEPAVVQVFVVRTWVLAVYKGSIVALPYSFRKLIPLYFGLLCCIGISLLL